MKNIVRNFFKTVRWLLGPVMLLSERLNQPRGLVRLPELQTTVNLQCGQLALYQYTTCPFCIRVRQEMRRLSLPIEQRDAQHEGLHRSALQQGGGATKVPCLQIRDAAGQAQWLYGSKAIIGYLRARFSP
jgi:glutaredoxin